jgi:hypothetical protein
MSKTLFLSPPSFDGFDGGVGAHYQARRGDLLAKIKDVKKAEA